MRQVLQKRIWIISSPRSTASLCDSSLPAGMAPAPFKWVIRISATSQPNTGFFMNPGYRYPKYGLPPGSVTAQYLPVRPDLFQVIEGQNRGVQLPHTASEGALGHGTGYRRMVDVLQKGDVLVVDLFGSVDAGGPIGDNMATAIYAATHAWCAISTIRRTGDAFHVLFVEGFQSSCELLPFCNPRLPPGWDTFRFVYYPGKVGDSPWECWGELGKVGESWGESGSVPGTAWPSTRRTTSWWWMPHWTRSARWR